MSGRRCFGGGGVAGSVVVRADPLRRWRSLELHRLARDFAELEDLRISPARCTTARSRYAVDLELLVREEVAEDLRGGAGGVGSSLFGGGVGDFPSASWWAPAIQGLGSLGSGARSEERRVGKECRL